MKFAILAPGGIAKKMATAVQGIIEQEKDTNFSDNKIELYAVASRSLERAKEFATKWGFSKAYGSYVEMLEDKEIDLVYVASPHSHHFEHTKMCLEHGKNVLVEKAFTVNVNQAKELVGLAKEKNLLLAEAIWTRYMPARDIIDEVISSGIIGKITSLTANLGYALEGVTRLREPKLAGGALLDLGVYPINFALMVFGNKIKNISSTAVLSPAGIDWINSITFSFEDGKMAILHSNMLAVTDRKGVIFGDKGYLEVYNINNCEGIKVFDVEHKLIKEYSMPEQINGYEYEVLACRRALEKGQIECEEMPHSETLRVMEIMDTIRSQWGMKYPCE